MSISEIQRIRVLQRWRKKDEYDLKKAVSDIEERRRLQVVLISYLQGDGCICVRYDKPNVFRYDLAFYPDHISLAIHFVDIYKKLYGRVQRIKNLGNYFSVRVTQKFACKELLGLAKFNSLEWQVPFKMLDTDEKKSRWLKAFFDCEAYVCKKSIVVQSVNKTGILQIKKLLEEFNIQSRFYSYERKQKNWNTNYLLFVSCKKYGRRFLKQIGFTHQLKQKKLALFARVA